MDAVNAAVFVRARDVGLTGLELPEQLEARPTILALLDASRVQAFIRMGITSDVDSARKITIVLFALVCPPADSPTLSSDPVRADEADLTA